MAPLIITAALTGAEVSRNKQPALPITPDEIAEAAAECVAAGAAIVHLHARLPDGSPTQDAGVYREMICAIRERCDVIIQVSTGGAVGMSSSERLAPVLLAPELPIEMATLSLGSVNFGDEVFLNPLADIRHFAATMQQRGVKAELEIFDAGMLETARHGINANWLPARSHFDFVLGVPGGIPATPEALMYLKSQLPIECTWSVAALGAAQLPITTLAILIGGHIRVGFEDNIWFRKGELANSNAQLVSRSANIARDLERKPATVSEARKILGLPVVTHR